MYNVLLCVKGGSALIDEKNTDKLLNNEEIQENEIQNTEPSVNTDTDAAVTESTVAEAAADGDVASADAENTEDASLPDIQLEGQLLLPIDGDKDAENEESADGEGDSAQAGEGGNKDSAEENAPQTAPDGERSRKVDSLFDFIELFVFTLAAVFIITSFFFRYSIVKGPSMMNTLEDGDKLLLTSFMYEPECGDVIVFHVENAPSGEDVWVKRVIATEGQTVRITYNDVYVDGEKLIEPYVYTGDYGSPGRYHYFDREDKYLELVVPEGEVFVMGDHRNNSSDSRVIGTVEESAILGKVIYRFFPFDSMEKIESVRITED